jgi:NIMA (never in mitosis gene a)-related kinase
LIGRGHYGRVYLVVDKRTNQTFVAKKIDFQGMPEEEQQKALKETQIHQKLAHKNILHFKEYYLENDMLVMIMEYCEFGDLSVYVKERKEKGELFEEALIVNWLVQMLFGLNYLHERKVLHRDIKSQNIFIDSEGAIKLADFGISKMLEHTQNLASTVVGTPYYLSPEAWSSTGYNFKSDIWSLGCVLYELCTL